MLDDDFHSLWKELDNKYPLFLKRKKTIVDYVNLISKKDKHLPRWKEFLKDTERIRCTLKQKQNIILEDHKNQINGLYTFQKAEMKKTLSASDDIDHQPTTTHPHFINNKESDITNSTVNKYVTIISYTKQK
eukprot:UN25402